MAVNSTASFARVDALIVEASAAMRALQECWKITAALQADHAAKQRELNAEFAGKIPPAFGSLLLKKRKRADQQQQRCLETIQAPSQLLTQAHNLMRQFEPKNAPGIDVRFKKIEVEMKRHTQLITPMKGPKK